MSYNGGYHIIIILACNHHLRIEMNLASATYLGAFDILSMPPATLSITDTRYADTGTGTAIRRYGDFQKIRIRRYDKYIDF